MTDSLGPHQKQDPLPRPRVGQRRKERVHFWAGDPFSKPFLRSSVRRNPRGEKMQRKPELTGHDGVHRVVVRACVGPMNAEARRRMGRSKGKGEREGTGREVNASSLARQVEGLNQKCEKMRRREGGVCPSSPSSPSSALIPLLGIFWQGRRANEAYSEREGGGDAPGWSAAIIPARSLAPSPQEHNKP